MTIQYRPATSNDAAQIAAIGASVWISTYTRESLTKEIAHYVLEEFTEARMAERIAQKDACILVAQSTSDGGLLGFLDMSLSARSDLIADSHQAEITRLYVLGKFARMGVGKALLHQGVDIALAHGATVAWLSAWSGNDRALAFYRALGWTHVGQITFMLGTEAIPNEVFAFRKTETS